MYICIFRERPGLLIKGALIFNCIVCSITFNLNEYFFRQMYLFLNDKIEPYRFIGFESACFLIRSPVYVLVTGFA